MALVFPTFIDCLCMLCVCFVPQVWPYCLTDTRPCPSKSSLRTVYKGKIAWCTRHAGLLSVGYMCTTLIHVGAVKSWIPLLTLVTTFAPYCSSCAACSEEEGTLLYIQIGFNPQNLMSLCGRCLLGASTLASATSRVFHDDVHSWPTHCWDRNFLWIVQWPF